jgi:hypothetical protein
VSSPPRRRLWRLGWTALVAAACATVACGGDDDGGPPAGDAGPAIDARPAPDAALIACSVDAGCDAETPAPLCNLERNVCVECLEHEDCDRSGSFGPRCNDEPGYCQCDDDDDCEGNPNGPWCDEIMQACTCLLDIDCASDEECELQPYLGSDVRTCRQRGDAALSQARELRRRLPGRQ